jgi:protein O-mannosyl-transferase
MHGGMIPAAMRFADRRARIFAALLLGAALAGVYARAFDGPFVFDDQTAIVDNDSLAALWPLSHVLLQPPDLTTSGRPVVAASLALNRALGGLDPRGYRAANAALHWLCALLLFGVVRRTLASPRLSARLGAHATALAAASAALYALHPLASEVVCYVSARTESTVALFYLATLYCAIRAREAESPRRWIAVAALACALGMASKEVMATAPLVVALHGIVFWGFGDVRQRRVQWETFAGLALGWIVLGALVAASPRGASVGFDHWVTPVVYLANQGRVLPRMLRLVIAPAPLVLDYGTPVPLSLADVWPGALFLTSLLAASLFALWRWPSAGFVGVACFAILAPSSSFFPIASEVGAERRMDLPLAALVALGVVAGWRVLERARAGRAAPGLAAAALAALAALSFARAGDYQTEIALWQHDVQAWPDNQRAHYNLAKALERAGRTGEARAEMKAAVLREIDLYERALPLQPDGVGARVDLGALHELAGQPERAEALYRDALALSPSDPYALRRMALLLVRNRAGDPAEVARALGYAEHAVAATERRDAAALEASAEVELASGDREAAISALREAAATDPSRQSPRVLERVRAKLDALEASSDSSSP